MNHSKSLFLRPHLPDECKWVLDCVFFSSNELRNLACGNGGKKVVLCCWVFAYICVKQGQNCPLLGFYSTALAWFVHANIFTSTFVSTFCRRGVQNIHECNKEISLKNKAFFLKYWCLSFSQTNCIFTARKSTEQSIFFIKRKAKIFLRGYLASFQFAE